MTSTSSEKSSGRSRKEKLLQDSSLPQDSSRKLSEHDENQTNEAHATTASTLSLLVFFVLLVMVSIGLWFLFVNWPKTSDEPDAKIPMTEAILRQATRWYEAEVVGDDHGPEELNAVGEAHGQHVSHHEDEGEKFYWEEEWPEAKEEDDEHDVHGSGGNHHHSESDQSAYEVKTSSEEVPIDHKSTERAIEITDHEGKQGIPEGESKPEQVDGNSQDHQPDSASKKGFEFETGQFGD